MGFLASVLIFIGQILILLIILRALLSWIRPSRGSRWLWEASRFLDDATEPFVAPVRRVLPDMGMIDFSPMVTIILIYIAIRIIGWILG